MTFSQNRLAKNNCLLLAGLLALIGTGLSSAFSGNPEQAASSDASKNDSVATYHTSTMAVFNSPEHIVGAASCKECHKAEHATWTATVHSKNFARIGSPSGQKISAAFGNTDACLKCHSTPHAPTAKFDSPQVGVSCESCHSAAGGSEGWFKLHSNYGGEGVKRGDETEAHRKERLAACDASGMIRASNVYALAKNCYSCHVVADEKLLAAGHKPGHSDFDLIPWMQGEVRHNFQVDQTVNAESPSLLKARDGITTEQRKRVLLVVSRMVELETLLRNLGLISEENLGESYAGRRGWAGRAEDVYEYLDEEIGKAIDNEHVKAAVDAVKEIELGRKFEDQAAAIDAADQLAEIAQAFLKSAGEADLGGLDPLIEELDKPVGKPYLP
ncbi:MAG: multiheme c-type cytochrome [Planctomycetaceae bacterium]|jgi:hypothetical protein|nr:multiheme c-type cytochrome [Planctomycetaceae bacterium]